MHTHTGSAFIKSLSEKHALAWTQPPQCFVAPQIEIYAQSSTPAEMGLPCFFSHMPTVF